MSRFPRPVRLASVGALAASILTLFASTPAGATITGSLAPSSNPPGVTYTYSVMNEPSNSLVRLFVYPSGHTCAVSDTKNTASYFLDSDPFGNEPSFYVLGVSGSTLSFGSTMAVPQPGAPSIQGTLPEGSFAFCLYSVSMGAVTILGQQTATLVNPNATTTTTAASNVTTTTAAGSTAADPAVPAFTG